MTSLRRAQNYNIGLDIGTGSVGWAVTDAEGELYHFKGRPTMGSRVYSSAQTAADARGPRGQRRRYERRRQRLNLLQEFFLEDIQSIDPDFFIRLNHSYLVADDRDFHHPLFNGEDFTEQEYYQAFPTIYHLRSWLMKTDEKADIRLIYLALHNIVKHRGNFLYQDNPSLSAKNANTRDSVTTFCDALQDWCDINEVSCNPDIDCLVAILEDASSSKRSKQEQLESHFGFDKAHSKTAKALSQAFIGYQADYSQIYFRELEGAKFSLTNDEKTEEFLQICPDEGLPLFESIRAVYSAFVLSSILKGSDGATLSDCKVQEYERYRRDLRLLKNLVKTYAPKSYDSFFRGEYYEGTTRYDVSKAQGYTRYNLGPSKLGSNPKIKTMGYRDFEKTVKKLFEGTEALQDPDYISMMEGFEQEEFLRRLKTSDNGSIPYQLHLEEMRFIIDNQSRYYPFLDAEKEKLCSLVSFRIPYYVGPLTQKNAALDKEGAPRFAWSCRKPGKEKDRIYPWNWDQIIDKNKSAEAFINRMTGTCTYLQGEPVLPKCSLLYEEYCVLNELNGAKYTQDGDDFRSFDYDDRADLIDDLFRKGSVSYKKVADWMRLKKGFTNVHVKGGQGETKFESRLSSYIFFSKDVFKCDELPEGSRDMVEEIILWSTLFEDRNILKAKLEEKYGDRLDAAQIKTICKKRFTGWGRLSRKFLKGITISTDNGPKTIMDVLWEGNPNNSGRSKTMVLMQVLHDDDLKFQEVIDNENRKRLNSASGMYVDDLPGSPALRRSINQALRVVEEIAGIAGCVPDNIFVEVTREEDSKKKGQRTKSRYDKLKKALQALKNESPAEYNSMVAEQLQKNKNDIDDRLMLYFLQNGKCLYSGKSLEIDRLSEYQIDHILPQSYIKDDSLDNKALVFSDDNQNKSDALLISSSIRRKMKNYWTDLHNAGLMSDKKYNNLLRDSITDRQIKGFIARQLVETSQIVKHVSLMLEDRYPETRVLPIKAALSSSLRSARNLVKCRDINDYHHAHDALLACQIGRFIQLRHAGMYDNPIGYTKVVRDLVKTQSDLIRDGKLRTPGSAGFIIGSFLTSGFSKETGEIFKDTWDADFEVERIRRYLDYKDCFISHMPEETSGAFWDSTIYSPRSGKTSALPIKNGLDSACYGSYSREQFAYFFIYEVRDCKKDICSFEFAPVPLYIAPSIAQDPEGLERYARNLAEAQGKSFVRIARAKINKYQLIELNGDRFFIVGKRDVLNATAFAFSQAETEIFKRLTGDDMQQLSVTTEECQMLFDVIKGKYHRYAKRLGNRLCIDDIEDTFKASGLETQKSVLVSLVSIAAAKTNAIDLSGIGRGASVGRMRLTFSKEFSSSSNDLHLIDQSVTGMFERRTKLEL